MTEARFHEIRRQQADALRNQSEDCLYLNLYVPAEGRATITMCFAILL